MTEESDHEVIQFELTANESEWVESSLNASYNIVKADWPKFAETLQIFSSQIGNQIQKLSQTPSNATQLSHQRRPETCRQTFICYLYTNEAESWLFQILFA